MEIPEELFLLAHLFLVVMWWSFDREDGEILVRSSARVAS